MIPRVMRVSASVLAVLVCAVVAAGQPRAADDVKVLRFLRAWDGTGVVADATIIVKGTRIVSVSPSTGSGRSRSGAVPGGAAQIDLRRYTAIPGLIDLHTHATYYWDPASGTRPLQQPRRPPGVTVVLAQDNLRRTLETGGMRVT